MIIIADFSYTGSGAWENGKNLDGGHRGKTENERARGLSPPGSLW